MDCNFSLCCFSSSSHAWYFLRVWEFKGPGLRHSCGNLSWFFARHQNTLPIHNYFAHFSARGSSDHAGKIKSNPKPAWGQTCGYESSGDTFSSHPVPKAKPDKTNLLLPFASKQTIFYPLDSSVPALCRGLSQTSPPLSPTPPLYKLYFYSTELLLKPKAISLQQMSIRWL